MTQSDEEAFLIGKVADLVLDSERIVVFTGAGVSTESGIPDFRSPGGIWSKQNPDDFTYQKFLSSQEARKKSWGFFRDSKFLNMEAEPNAAHYAVAELGKMGKLQCVITQNVDGLHQKAGNPDDKVIELHGTMKWAVCLNCGKRYPMGEILDRLEGGVEVPDCEHCHGILKPAGIFFGEALPQKALADATNYSRNCDLCIVMGSTLVVYPAAYMPVYALQAGAKLVIINITSTPLDQQATVLLHSKVGEAMTKVMEQVRKKASA